MKIDISELDKRVELGLIEKRYHPHLPLILWHYTQDCMFRVRNWDYFTRSARGLVTYGSEIICFPMEKFFNLGELPSTMASALPKENYTVTEKVDGSMILCYSWDEEVLIHTKGTWNENEQSRRAKARIFRNLDLKKLVELTSKDRITLMFEITFPGNAVIRTSEENITLIGARSALNGIDHDHSSLLTIADYLDCHAVNSCDITMEDACAFNEPQKEGFVVRFDSGLRVKIKTKWFWEASKVRYSLSLSRVIDALQAGVFDINKLDEVDFPEEDRKLFIEFAEYVRIEYLRLKKRAEKALNEASGDRKEKALFIIKNYPDVQHVCFAALSGRDTEELVWKALRNQEKNNG